MLVCPPHRYGTGLRLLSDPEFQQDPLSIIGVVDTNIFNVVEIGQGSELKYQVPEAHEISGNIYVHLEYPGSVHQSTDIG